MSRPLLPEEATCPICLTERSVFQCTVACSHSLCTRCAVSYLRSALGDVQAMITCKGVRCPMHTSGCTAYIGALDAAKLLTQNDARLVQRMGNEVLQSARGTPLQRFVGRLFGYMPDDPSDLSLSIKEVRQLERHMVEAAIPPDQQCWCPKCGLLVLRAPLAPPSRLNRLTCRPCCGRDFPHDVQCPHCGHEWDMNHRDDDQGSVATSTLVWVTSKACPNRACGQRISHFHGHGCHHISPLTDGCPSCHQHFCFVCRRRHGTPGVFRFHPSCSHRSSFCVNENIMANIVQLPYPHDRRCGCLVCSHCAPRRPCPQCDGRCIVCLSMVPPGPSELSPEGQRLAKRRIMQAKRRCAVM